MNTESPNPSPDKSPRGLSPDKPQPSGDPSASGQAGSQSPIQPAGNPLPAVEGLAQAAEELAEQEEHVQEVTPERELPAEPPTIEETVKTLLVGKPLSLVDKTVFKHISLVAFLAWVGLGADGLSSSCYGPSEAFAHLTSPFGEHYYLAVFLALATVFTVIVISACYSYIIEAFPSGGGGYLVASKMLGPKVGALAGSALVIDYILTVTVSIAAAGDALFGLIPPDFLGNWNVSAKLWVETAAIGMLIVLNLRGVKESINVLMPIFLVFLATHVVLIGGVISTHLWDIGGVTQEISTHMRTDLANPSLGWAGVLGMLLYAYSLGAGTYTGIEAVSNSMPVMREPRVATAQRTMFYMAISLAITAGGLMLAYLLMDVKPAAAHPLAAAAATEGENTRVLKGDPSQKAHIEKTMNHRLTEKFVAALPDWVQSPFVWITILSEAALLIVAAQAGFIGGPKCLANMANDSWVPHWFGSLSERLSSHNGILLIGVAALAALWANGGSTSLLIVLYSINVFVTFSLSMLGMCLHWYALRGKDPKWRARLALFAFGAILCLSILGVTVCFKFFEGAWKTVLVTGVVTGLCLLIRRYYRNVSKRLKGLDESLGTIEIKGAPTTAELDPDGPTAAVLVGGYSGLGVHTLLNALRFVPNHFKNIVFISAGVVDSGNFKGAEAVEALREYTEETLGKYVDLARRIGLPARGYMSIGTDVVDELEQICRVVARDFPQTVVFAGQLVFQRETWYGPLLHNQTAYSLQRRLQWDGVPMVILPTRVREP
jgi:amino acid transporter